MPPSRRKWNFKNLFTAKNGGCGCDPKATDAIEPKPISKTTSSSTCRRPSSAADDGDGGGSTSSTTFSLLLESSPHTKMLAAGDKTGGSLAVVKDSDDPYGDFRRSMLQMIIEKEIYSRDELHHLLRCFLELNSPRHHDVIVRAFTEICGGGAAVEDGSEERFPPLWSRENA